MRIEPLVVEFSGHVVLDAVVEPEVVEVVLGLHLAVWEGALPGGTRGQLGVQLLLKVAHGQVPHEDSLGVVPYCVLTRKHLVLGIVITGSTILFASH